MKLKILTITLLIATVSLVIKSSMKPVTIDQIKKEIVAIKLSIDLAPDFEKQAAIMQLSTKLGELSDQLQELESKKVQNMSPNQIADEIKTTKTDIENTKTAIKSAEDNPKRQSSLSAKLICLKAKLNALENAGEKPVLTVPPTLPTGQLSD